MKRFVKEIFFGILGVLLLVSTAPTDVAKGQRIYVKQLRVKCGISGSDFAAKHTQDKWEQIYDEGKLGEEIKKICNGNTVGEKSLPHIYDFAYEYASDSGNVPNS